MRKALGRCKAGHCTVVEHQPDTLPAGVCKHAHELIEWAVKPD